MLNGHQRIGAEGLQSKGVAGGAQVLGAEAGVVSLEELHDHIDDGALSGAHRSVEDQKLCSFLDSPVTIAPMHHSILCRSSGEYNVETRRSHAGVSPGSRG